MALEINWTRQANKKFDKILEYLLDEWNWKSEKLNPDSYREKNEK